MCGQQHSGRPGSAPAARTCPQPSKLPLCHTCMHSLFRQKASPRRTSTHTTHAAATRMYAGYTHIIHRADNSTQCSQAGCCEYAHNFPSPLHTTSCAENLHTDNPTAGKILLFARFTPLIAVADHSCTQHPSPDRHKHTCAPSHSQPEAHP